VQEAVVLKCFAEAEVGDHDDNPGDEAGYGGDIHEPVEDGGAGVGDVKVGEQGDRPGKEDGDVRDAVSVSDAEELGCFVTQRHRVEDSGA